MTGVKLSSLNKKALQNITRTCKYNRYLHSLHTLGKIFNEQNVYCSGHNAAVLSHSENGSGLQKNFILGNYRVAKCSFWEKNHM